MRLTHATLAACLFAAACARAPKRADILLFDGKGTSAGDVAAIEQVLRGAHLSYATANSRQLAKMSAAQLRAYQLLIVPGGNFETIGKSLTPVAVTNVRGAVHSGLNYLGICAGAFFAGSSPYNGLNLTSGVRFPFYAAEARGIRKAAVQIARADSASLEEYWEDGPQLTGWGEVVAKYDDGTPAVAQGEYGNGWVLLLGTHPEAPDSWRRGRNFRSTGDASRAYAKTLILAALTSKRLPHY